MEKVNINGQLYNVDVEVAEQFSKFIRRSKAKDDRIKYLEQQIIKAISSVNDGHEDDIGYNVLCALGAEC